MNKIIYDTVDEMNWWCYDDITDLWTIKLPREIAIKILECKSSKINKYKMMIFTSYLLNSLDLKSEYYNYLNKKTLSLKGKDKRKHLRKFEFGTEVKYVNINTGLLREYFGGSYKKSVIKPLKDIQVIESDRKYLSRSKSLGYTINTLGCKDNQIMIVIDSKTYNDKIRELDNELSERKFGRISPTHKYIIENLNKFHIDTELLSSEDLNLYNNSKKEIDRINSENNNFNFRWSRLYTKFTNMKKELRPYLRIKNSNEKLIEIDISNSYLCMLIYHIEHFELKIEGFGGYTTKHDSFFKFKNDVINGKIYDDLADSIFNGDRRLAKSIVFRVLFSSYWVKRKGNKPIDKYSDLSKYQILVSEYIIKKYISVGLYIKDKISRDYLRMFSIELSMIESRFMFDNFLIKIKDIPFVTIHDSIIIPDQHKEYVLEIMKETSSEYFKFQLPLKVKTL